MFSIVFAVLLALALDSWQEQVKKNAKRDHALNDVVLEVLSFSALDGAVRYNRGLLDSLRDEIERHESGESVIFSEGLGRPEVKSLAWSIAQTTGIASEFDRALLLELAEIYTEHKRLMNILDMHNEFLLMADPDMPPFTRARHIERYFDKAIFRMEELDKKAGAFLEKHQEADFMKALHD